MESPRLSIRKVVIKIKTKTMDVASTTALISDAVADWAGVAYAVLGIILPIFAVLLALGFGISRIRRYISGRKG